MVVDTSAIIAILYNEAESTSMLHALEHYSQQSVVVSACTYVEAFTVVYSRHGEKGVENLNALLHAINVTLLPFDAALINAACDAYRRYRSGRNGLNFGDCFSYALAKARGEALLCKGNDFIHTDIELVAY